MTTTPTSAAHQDAPLVVSGIGVVTPRGDRPREAARGARPAAAARAGDWFDHRTRLGPRGYKYLPAASQYFLAAAKEAMADARDEPDRWPAELRGAAVGTNSSAAALHEAMDRTVLAEGAAALSPVTAPYFSINLFGSRLATEHGLKAFNLTVTSPRVAGLESLETGAWRPGPGPSPPAGRPGCSPEPPRRPSTPRTPVTPTPNGAPSRSSWSRWSPSGRAAAGPTGTAASGACSCPRAPPPRAGARNGPGS
ncbi:beta-ketoacyl synthase N-terminal-like domain-containing protein [Streptomyces katrae]|uniref:beta-ketoacyl synthase N-terminal-like domain-containing protein n=1 Tax=Streptomyces katrae TaxID=68223 RepID=UPI0006967C9D|nr:beta-ketoacyl synthase N-terminal-like domain-containing protein [Streptomyces katrae]